MWGLRRLDAELETVNISTFPASRSVALATAELESVLQLLAITVISSYICMYYCYCTIGLYVTCMSTYMVVVATNFSALATVHKVGADVFHY